MKRRMISGIALYPSNESGGYYFMSIHTGKIIHGHQWEEQPISDYVVDIVEELAYNEGKKKNIDC